MKDTNFLIQTLQSHIYDKFKGFPINKETQDYVEVELNDLLARMFPEEKKHFYVVTHMQEGKNITFFPVYKQ